MCAQVFLTCAVCGVTRRARGALAYVQAEAIGHQAVQPFLAHCIDVGSRYRLGAADAQLF